MKGKIQYASFNDNDQMIHGKKNFNKILLNYFCGRCKALTTYI